MDVLGIPSTMHLVSIDDTGAGSPGLGRLRVQRRAGHARHLIVQYPADGEFWPRRTRNRVIYVTRPAAPRACGSRPTCRTRCAAADVFLLSSFNVIQDPATLELRLAQVRDAMPASRRMCSWCSRTRGTTCRR